MQFNSNLNGPLLTVCRRPLLPSIGNDPGAPDAEVEPFDAVAAADGHVQARVPPARLVTSVPPMG